MKKFGGLALLGIGLSGIFYGPDDSTKLVGCIMALGGLIMTWNAERTVKIEKEKK